MLKDQEYWRSYITYKAQHMLKLMYTVKMATSACMV